MPRQVTPLTATVASPPRATGMPVDVQLIGTLPPGAELLDHLPRTRDTLPGGVRILSSDSLRVDHGTVIGHLRLAFFRPDSQNVPSFLVAYRAGARADTLASSPIRFFIRPVLPVGNATLRDIRDVDPPWLAPVSVASAATVLALFFAVVAVARRVARRRPVPVAVAPAPPPPYAVALAALDAIEAQARLSIDHHYAQVADVVRRYLEDAHAIPALERTTPEILDAVPPAVAGDRPAAALRALLGEADYVKFARLRPTDGTFTARARAVLAQWDAVR